jgi:hypothetical protein
LPATWGFHAGPYNGSPLASTTPSRIAGGRGAPAAEPCYRRTRREVFPILSRVQNIGYEQGENDRTPEWYRTNHRTPWVADAAIASAPFSL